MKNGYNFLITPWDKLVDRGWRNINVSKANRKPTSLLSIRFSLVHHGFLCPFCNLQLRDCACHSHAFEITTTGKQITKFATCKSRFVSPSLVHSSSVSVPVHLTSPSIYITRGGGADVAYVIPRSSSTLARARACLKGGFPCSAEHQKRMEWTEMNWHAGGSQRIWHSCLPCVVLLHIYSLRTRNTLPFRVFFSTFLLLGCSYCQISIRPLHFKVPQRDDPVYQQGPDVFEYHESDGSSLAYKPHKYTSDRIGMSHGRRGTWQGPRECWHPCATTGH